MKPDHSRSFAYLAIGVAVVAILMIMANFAYDDEAMWKENLEAFLERARGTPWALPAVCAAYVIGGFVFFPVILLNLVCAMVFGLWGIAYALIGCLVNVAVFFGIGHFLRHKEIGRKLFAHPTVHAVDAKLRNSGIAGIVMIHSLPAPPFTVTNFITGLSSINLATVMAGSFLALLPGAIARGIVGDSLTKIILHPTQETYMYLALGLVLWVALIATTHLLLKKYMPHEEASA